MEFFCSTVFFSVMCADLPVERGYCVGASVFLLYFLFTLTMM